MDGNRLNCAVFFRVFVATWNVRGKSLHSDLNLHDFLQLDNPSDIYVLPSWADFDKIGQGGFGAVYYAELTSKRKGRDETKRERDKRTGKNERRRRERREALA